ncbi:MAG: ribonuclease P [Candidatus Diapherotrites archaeon]|nr:ribonuclease P [Candidatus Diapherotrites archaeon]
MEKEETLGKSDKRAFEKKLKSNQKLALERIYRLFELAGSNEKYSKRYLMLAKRIGEKTRTSIPKKLKQQYCKNCYSMKVACEEKEPFLIIKCKKCGKIKKYGIKEKDHKKTAN